MVLMSSIDVPFVGISMADFIFEPEDIQFGTFYWFVYAGISCLLVLFAGIMSGLTLGLMSLGLVELEILQRSGSSTEKKQAAAILPVVQKQHQLLVTLLLCNACAMEALPIYLDKIFHPFVAVVLSVTFVLAFGEVIPQAICTRYGLAVGANFVWLVHVLMIICYPIAYPIGKVLDAILGHDTALFRRAQLKALVSIHSMEEGKGGELTHDETTIISGALDLTEKTAEEAMTPIESTFSLDVNSKLDWEAMGKILARGHSRVPVYSGNPKNIIGLLLVKSLLTVRPETETPVSAVSIRRIPRVPGDMPLYDILNEFQKGSSHMAAVVKVKGKNKRIQSVGDKERSEAKTAGAVDLKWSNRALNHEVKSDPVVDMEKQPMLISRNNLAPSQNDATENGVPDLSEDIEDGNVLGIITLEDVFEELLQEEIVDETDVYIDVHKRIRVAAAAAASSVVRAPSNRKLISQKAGDQSRHGQVVKKPVEKESDMRKPLLDYGKR
uniref:CNNM transmembrane domain-containing protein n=1 Tax=Opuntia streptacantha TaxID=393608 RepID=A0A7C9DFJ3_OPUST